MDEQRLAWYCVRTLHKREHVASTSLRTITGIEVFYPRLKWPRRTNRKILEGIEPLFPDHLFARFALASMVDRVERTPGVKAVVCTGDQWPIIPEAEMEAWKAEFGPTEILPRPAVRLEPGVDLATAMAVLKGFRVAARYDLPVARRVQVLHEILRRSRTISYHRISNGWPPHSQTIHPHP